MVIMKVNFKTLSLVLAIVVSVFATMPAHAFEVNYSSDDSVLTVSGSNGSADIAIAVMPYKYSADTLTTNIINSKDNVVFQHVKAGGDYIEDIMLPLNLPYGKYRVSEIIGGVASDSVFFKLDEVKIYVALSAINEANTVSEAKEALDALLAGTDAELVAKTADIAVFMYNQKPRTGYDEQSFVNSFALYDGVVSLDSGAITLAEFMEEYASVADEDCKESYGSLSETEKMIAEKSLPGVDFAGKSASEIVSELVLVAKVRNTGNYEDLRDIVLEYCENNDIELEDYDKLTNYQKDDIFIKLLTVKNNITNAEYITEKLEKYISDTLPKDSSGGGTPGGTSGDGGVSGGGYKVVTEEIDPAPATDFFADTKTHWAKNDINAMYTLGIVNGTGDGIFEPDRSVTRAEFVKMLTGALGIKLTDTKCDFDDVADDAWYSGYISTAVDMGIVNGVSDTKFAPLSPITREDASAMVYRAIKSKLSQVGINNYVDETQIADYALEGVTALSGAGVLKGNDGYFRPKANITRAEAAVLLLRVYDLR